MSEPETPKPEQSSEVKPTESAGCCGCGGSDSPEKGGPLSFLKKKPNRRDFLVMIGAGLNVAAGAMIGIPVLGYILSNFTSKSPQSWISLGPLAQFPENQTRMATYTNPGSKPWDGASANIPCWVRRMQGEQFQVFAINCAHLGCPVRWFQESKLFMCPCHGGVYYEDGRRASGPPPRGLYEYEFKIENGELWVLGGQIPTLSQSV